MVELKKGDFKEEEMIEERFLTSDQAAKSSKIAADTTFTDVTEGGIPITNAERIARANNEALGNLPGVKITKEYLLDPVYNAWDKVGRKVVDKLNPLDDDFFQKRKIQSENVDLQKRQAFAAYREKKTKTQDMLSQLLTKYKDKAENVRSTEGDEAADAVLEEYFASKNRLLKSANLLETDLVGTPIDLDTYMLRDDMDLWTDNPDPYPWIQFGEKFAASVYGTNKGFKAGEKLLTNKNLQKINTVFKAASKRGPWYVKLGGWAGRGATHPWTIKTIAALGGGGAGWGAADFGYELQLDAMNAAGKSKAYLESSDDIRAQLISKAIPEALTFGAEGINRPGLGQRSFNAIDEAVTDAALSAPFFMLRPIYNGLRTAVSKSPGIKMFKDPNKTKSEFGETTAVQDFENAEYLWKKYGGDLVQAEKSGFNVPFVGNILTRVGQSNAFDWLSTAGLSVLPKISKKFKGFETPPTVGRGEEQVIVPMGKYMFSDSFIAFTSKVLGRAPWLGGKIQKNLQRQSDMWLTAFDNMLGHMAPISHLATNNALNFGQIMGKGAEKFRSKAKEMSDKVVEIGGKYDTPISDSYLRSAGKEVIKQRKRYWQSQIDPNTGRQTKVPPEGGDPIIGFIERQILEAGTTGARNVEEYMALKAGIQELYQKGANSTLPVEDSVMTLLKGWDNDIGSLATHGIDDLSTAFKEYDEFVANGMMLYGSDIAKKAGVNMNQVGMNLRLAWDDKRTSQSLFDTIVKSGTETDVKLVKKLVGDQAFADGVDLYIRNAFNESLGKTIAGVRQFDFEKFRNSIGLGKGQTIEKSIFKEALNNEKVVIRGMDPKTGLMRNFSDEQWLGLAPSGRFVDDAADFAKKVDGDVIRTKVPSIDDFEKLITTLERVYKHGIPDVSTFMARKAVISSTNKGLTAFLPWSGSEGVQKGAAGILSLGMIKALAGAWLLRYGGGVLSSPVSSRAFRNTIDDTLADTIRYNNFAKLILRHPEEWRDFQMDLLELEDAQQKKNMGAQRMRDLRGRGEKLKDNVLNLGGEILENVPKALDMMDKVVPDRIGNVPVGDLPFVEKGGVEMGIEAAQEAMEAEGASNKTEMPSFPGAATDGFGTNSMAQGSSLANSQLNSEAAGALYAGDTDMALAAQYGGGQLAASGGAIEYNPIMDNQGNYTEPQKQINQNPFQNNKSGIMGIS